MVQELPRYCLRCSTPIRADMQRCATCDLSIEAMLRRPDNRQSETDKYNDAVLQRGNDEFLSNYQFSWNIPGESAPPPRFPPSSPLPPELDEWNEPDNQGMQASPPPLPPEQDERNEPDNQSMQASLLPPELDEWNEPDNQGMQQAGSAQQEPRFVPVQPPTGELRNDPDLIPLPDNPAILSSEAMSGRPGDGQSETGEYNDALLQGAIAPSPRRVRQEDDEFLSMSPEAQDRQPGRHVPGESPQVPMPPPISPFLPEPGERNKSRGRWRIGIILITLAVLFLLGGGGYVVFSDHLLGLNNSQVTITPTSISMVGVLATATAKAKNTNPYVSGGTLVFSDTLKTANTNWDQNAGCAFKGGSYQVTATTIQSCALKAHVALTNFILEVKVTLLQGDVGGLFFRENKLYNRSNAYLLDFDNKGNYQLWDYQVSRDAKLIDHGVSVDVKTGYNQMNVIALVVQGPSITLYINGQMVKHFIDSTHNSGGLSLFSSEYSHHTGTSKAAYSDLRLWRL